MARQPGTAARKGDAVYFESSVLYRGDSAGDAVLIVLMVISSPEKR